MPINQYYEFVCDNCGQACYHSARKKSDAIHHAKKANVIVKAGKYILCNKKCLREWKKKQNV